MAINIELLSPAKNLVCGMEAINHGADAVYLGAAKFGARAAAGNSLSDIEQLCRYAHRYRAKVYVTLNTILTNQELAEAQKMIWELYRLGIDALIIQDMGILMLDLPPIPLHASTQTDNRTVEKVSLLKESGIQRVVLARELSLQEISSIHQQCDIELEAFVHGALCVSYSGQCYMSYHSCGRSANRGECAQFCRLPYNLQDADGKVLVHNKYLLSLKDLNRSASIEEMIQAGVGSFKIEGRLKEVSYVKNITAFYRQKIDAVLEGMSDYQKASSGNTIFHFIPDPNKSFHRGSTDYFLHGRKETPIQPNTPKSIGAYIGKVQQSSNQFFTIDRKKTLTNGDGLCYFNEFGELEGFKINKIENEKIYPAQSIVFEPKTDIYRNYDHAFEKLMQQKTAERKIALDITIDEQDNGFLLTFTDEDGVCITHAVQQEKSPAIKAEQAAEQLKIQLSKLGNTLFALRHLQLNFSQPFFIPASQLADWRREGIELLLSQREEQYQREVRAINQTKNLPAIYKDKTISYLCNVMNNKAKEYYLALGASNVKPAMEKTKPDDAVLMYCKHCIKYALKWCPKYFGDAPQNFREPLYLNNGKHQFRLEFDCGLCEMRIYSFTHRTLNP